MSQMEKSFHFNHSRPLAAIRISCRTTHHNREQLDLTGEIGVIGARYRCYQFQKISIISFRHRHCSYIVTSMEDIGTTRMANREEYTINSSNSRQNVSNNLQSLNIFLVILDTTSYAQDLVLLS